MKRFILGSLAVFLAASPLAFVYAKDGADDGSNSDSRGGNVFQLMRDTMKEKHDALEQKHQELEQRHHEMELQFEEKRSKLEDARHKKIADILANLTQRFQKAIDRMNDIADRVQTRITDLEGQGVDLTDAQKSLDAAKATLNDAQSALNDIDTPTLIASTTPTTALKGLRADYAAVKELLKKAHGQLADAISAIKKGFREQHGGDDATSTDDNASSTHE